jgi:hypothetical protein
MLTDDAMRESSDRCLAAYLRHLAVTATGGRWLHDDRFLLFAGGHNYPGTYTNGAIRTSPMVTPAELLATADEFFGEIGRPYMVWVRDHADADLEASLRRRGCWLRPPEAGNPGIAHDAALPPEPIAPEVEVRVADNDEDFLAYRRVIAHGYQLPDADDDLIETVLFSLASLQVPESKTVIATYRGKPVAGCMSFMVGDEAGLQWAATLPETRGKGLGLGRLVFERACNLSFEAGARCVSALASAQGVPIWTAMGFRVITHYRRYLVTQHLEQRGGQRAGTL